MNPKVDFYFTKATKWQKEIEQLRTIILDCGLEEELKWGCPCYTHATGSSESALHKANIVLIHLFKEYCAVLFFKGALLNDTSKILVQQTKNVQSARQVRFTSVKEITKMERTLKEYIYEAIAIEKSGLKVTLKKTAEFNMPEEFQQILNKTSALKKAFEALTPGRQKGYLLYFSQAKQLQTKVSRIEKSMPQILKGNGLND